MVEAPTEALRDSRYMPSWSPSEPHEPQEPQAAAPAAAAAAAAAELEAARRLLAELFEDEPTAPEQ